MITLFYIFAAITLLGALGVILLRNPMHAAISLLFSLLGVALLFFLQRAPFLGAVQILVYAGGVLVLFLFGIMFVSLKNIKYQKAWRPYWPGAWFLGILFALFLLAHLKLTLAPPKTTIATTIQRYGGHVEGLGQTLYTHYLMPFEVASLFLLVAMVGAILLAQYGGKR